MAKSLEERVRSRPVVWFLGTLAVGFGAALTAVAFLLELTRMQVVPLSYKVMTPDEWAQTSERQRTLEGRVKALEGLRVLSDADKNLIGEIATEFDRKAFANTLPNEEDLRSMFAGFTMRPASRCR